MTSHYVAPEEYGHINFSELLPLVARLFLLALKLVTMASWYPFSGTEFSLKRYMLRQFIGTVLPSNTDKQLQWILPSTGTTYTRYQRSLSSKSAVVSESIGHGAWVHWIGPKTNKKVMYYIHGGGFLLPIFDGHLKMIDWWRTEASKHDVDFSVAVLEYTLANHAPWPTQLLQTSAGLAHLLQQGYDPADITIAGDSAGGHQVACLLSHIIHPHPDVAPVKLGRPLAGAAIMSGWLTFGITTSSWKRFGTEDAMAPLMALLRWSKLLIETKRSTGDDFYLEAALAPSDWWAGLGSATKNVLLTAGEREGMVDDIVNTKRKMEVGAGNGVKIALFVQDGGSHIEAAVDFACDDGPGPTNFRVSSWIQEVYA